MLLRTTETKNDKKEVISTEIALVDEKTGEELDSIFLETSNAAPSSKIKQLIKIAYDAGRSGLELNDYRVEKDEGIF